MVATRTAATSICKVRAHQTDHQLYACSLDEWRHALGNQLADTFAKDAARLAAAGEDTARTQLDLDSRCRLVWERLAMVGAAVHRDPSSARAPMRHPGGENALGGEPLEGEGAQGTPAPCKRSRDGRLAEALRESEHKA